MKPASHYARVSHSKRLQRLLSVLSDGGWHTTLDLVKKAKICAVNTAVHELRQNGYGVECKCMGRTVQSEDRHAYRLIA